MWTGSNVSTQNHDRCVVYVNKMAGKTPGIDLVLQIKCVSPFIVWL